MREAGCLSTSRRTEEKRGETGDQEASLDEEKEKSVGEKTRENSSTDNKDGKRIRPGAQMIATHDTRRTRRVQLEMSWM